MTSIRFGCCMAALLMGPACSAEPVMLEDGSYEIEVKLELPHLEDMTGKKMVRLCLTAEANGNNHGLVVLSDNNPLAHCPISDLRQEGSELTFAIACAGRNAAHATARYQLAPASFRGRIAMQMGGKNMTMTEVQAGRRIGACDAGERPVP